MQAMQRWSVHGRIGLLVAVLGLIGSAGQAQVHIELEAFQQVEFNFFPPGARATAMGGAFIALADDTTAAVTNPVGLAALKRPQVAFEYKNTNHRVERFATPDSLRTLDPLTFSRRVQDPAFMSIVLPKDNWAIALYRHEFLHIEDAYHLDSRSIPGWESRNGRFLPVDGTFNYRGFAHGVAFAVDLGRIDIGFNLKVSELKGTSRIRHDHCLPQPIGLCHRSSIAHVESLDSSSHGVGAAIGVIWHYSPKLSLGLVGELNPSFELDNDQRFGERPDGSLVLENTNNLKVGIPHRLGFGVTYRPINVLVLSSDILWVQYSRLLNAANKLTFQDLYSPAITPDHFFLRDRFEWHNGAEYIFFLGNVSVAARGGFFIMPRRRVHYRLPLAADVPTRSETFRFEMSAADLLYNGVKDKTLVGFSFGLGLVFSQFQVDFAYSSSDAIRQFSSSMVIQF